jgi:hypothetical protein
MKIDWISWDDIATQTLIGLVVLSVSLLFAVVAFILVSSLWKILGLKIILVPLGAAVLFPLAFVVGNTAVQCKYCTTCYTTIRGDIQYLLHKKKCLHPWERNN